MSLCVVFGHIHCWNHRYNGERYTSKFDLTVQYIKRFILQTFALTKKGSVEIKFDLSKMTVKGQDQPKFNNAKIIQKTIFC